MVEDPTKAIKPAVRLVKERARLFENGVINVLSENAADLQLDLILDEELGFEQVLFLYTNGQADRFVGPSKCGSWLHDPTLRVPNTHVLVN